MGLTEWISSRGSLIGIIVVCWVFTVFGVLVLPVFSPLDGGAPCLKAQAGLPQLLRASGRCEAEAVAEPGMNNSWGTVAHAPFRWILNPSISPTPALSPALWPAARSRRSASPHGEEASGAFLASSQRELINPFPCWGFTLKPNDGRQRGCPLCPDGEGAVLA